MGLVNFNAWMIPSNFRVCVATCFGQVRLSCSLCIICEGAQKKGPIIDGMSKLRFRGF